MNDNTKVHVEGPYEAIHREFCWELENKVIIPILQDRESHEVLSTFFSRFGVWDNYKEQMDEMLSDEVYYKNQYEDMEREKEEAKEKLRDMKHDLQGVIDDLDNIPMMEDKGIEETITECVKRLCVLAAGERLKQQKRRKKI